jgi:hypothetical protein
MSSLLAHIKIVEGQEQKFEDLSKELYKQSHANEDCIIRYEYYRGREKNSYYTLLVYPSYLDFLLKHQISQYDGVIEDIDLEWLDAIEDAAPVGITEMQKVPENSSDLAKEYGVSHAAEIQDWWLKLRNVY